MTETELLHFRDAIFGPELAAYTLLLLLFAAFAGMMKGPQNGRPMATVRVYRKTGVGVFITFAPFVLSAVLNSYKGNLMDVLASSELAMAGALVSGNSAYRAYKGLMANEGVYDDYKFQFFMVMSIALCVGCAFLASWIILQEPASHWIGVSNLIVVLVVTTLSFGVTAAMAAIDENLP